APLNPAFSKEILNGINVSEATLQEFSNFFVWLEEQGIDPKAEGVHLIYVDDDLQTIPNSWVFMLSDYKPTLEASKDKSVEADMKTKDEMISYLSNFEKKYPVKQVDTGLVTFITVENKEVLLAEISEQDIRMLENISDAVIEESLSKRNEVLVSNWTSGVNGAPNMHEDMSRWAAEKAGFNSSMSNRIGSYADEPDDPENMTYDLSISGDDPNLDNDWYGLNLEKIVESNYNHYYDPTLYLPDLVDPPNQPILQYILDYYLSPPYDGTGGAPNQISKYIQRAAVTSSPVNQRAVNLSYASHFICDMSMPLHTEDAVFQAIINTTNPYVGSYV
ncbi:MAG: hypothetical protein LBU81_04065, partial [Methanosarcinales archaeon]|nr:hypothetical protein [Methanosarcinales archaeon]